VDRHQTALQGLGANLIPCELPNLMLCGLRLGHPLPPFRTLRGDTSGVASSSMLVANLSGGLLYQCTGARSRSSMPKCCIRPRLSSKAYHSLMRALLTRRMWMAGMVTRWPVGEAPS
jgi:hypothetical protein